MPVWKPTTRECELIKQAAAREAGIKITRVLLEPGVRRNIANAQKNEGARAIPHGALNIALISDDPEWNDTDLDDYGCWSDFRKGVSLTEDGRAIVDFYIRARMTQSNEDDLRGNVEVHYADGKIARIKGYPDEYPVQ